LPKEGAEEQLPEEDELAAHLAFRLQRLEAMRRAADALFRLPITGIATQIRGMPEGLRSRTTPLYSAELFDILQAYGQSRSKAAIRNHKLPMPNVLSLDDARTRLRRALASVGIEGSDSWTSFDALLPEASELKDGLPAASVKASSLLAGLELTKEGQMEIRQTGTFAPIYVRAAERLNMPESEASEREAPETGQKEGSQTND
jgi:segregation and condensation protein A